MSRASNIEPQWIATGIAALLVIGAGGYVGRRRLPAPCAPQGAARAARTAIAYEAAHQVLVPDGMGGYIHIDHLLLTPRGLLVLDTRRVAGLIFGGDQMSDWTVIGPAPLHFRQSAARALRSHRRREGAGRGFPGRGAAAVLEHRQVHQGHAQVRDDARRHRGGVSAGRPQPQRVRRARASPRRCGAGWLPSSSRARTSSPTFRRTSPVRRSARHCASSPRPPHSSDSPRSAATVRAMCGR